jgi:hypothetical protein
MPKAWNTKFKKELLPGTDIQSFYTVFFLFTKSATISFPHRLSLRGTYFCFASFVWRACKKNQFRVLVMLINAGIFSSLMSQGGNDFPFD